MRPTTHALAALTAIATLTACSGDDRPDRTAADPPSTSASSGSGYRLVGQQHLYGPGLWALPAVGDADAPLALLDVVEGYEGRDGFVWTHDEQDLVDQPGQVVYWAPRQVPDDPCEADRPSPRTGPGVTGLADALAAQKRTTTTRPLRVTLGGLRGLYLELSVPDRLDGATCGDGGMVLWTAGRQERVLEFPATERIWILDADGRRVVVSAMTPAGARGESVRRVTDVARGIRFVT